MKELLPRLCHADISWLQTGIVSLGSAQQDIHINVKCPHAGPQMSDVMKSYYLER